MSKFLSLILLMCCFVASVCLAEETAGGVVKEQTTTSLDEFERQVREVAERTAAAEKIRREEARKEEARAAEARREEEARNAQAPNEEIASAPRKTSESIRVFKYRKGGATVFTDKVPYKIRYETIVYNSCYACSLSSNVDWFNTRLHLTDFSDTIALAAREYRVDPALIRAIIHAESAFNPRARSRKGAMGLMQLMPGTAKDMGVTDSTNPEQNIKGGVKYLASLLQTFSGDEALATAAYNAGPAAVTRHGGIPPFEETQTYVKRVKILLERYKSQKVLADAR